MKKGIIVGTGISALSCGWFLKQKYKDQLHLTLIEKTDRCGGCIQTHHVKDFLFELGPRGFRPKEVTLELVKVLDLEKELIFANSSSKNRYLYQGGKLNRVSLPFLLKNGLLTAVCKDLFLGSSACEDESIADFIRRRFHDRFLKNVIDPIVKGVFGGNPEMLSMRSCFPYFWNLEKTYGSLVKGMWKEKKKTKTPSLASFKRGMHVLPETLVKKIAADFIFSCEIQKIEANGSVLLETNQGQLEADFLILAISDYEVSRFFKAPQVIEKKVSLSTVNLGWYGKKLPLQGYGFLTPSSENKKIMGVTFDSDIFPEQNSQEMTRLTVMIQSKEPLNDALAELKSLFAFAESPDALWVHTHEKAIPQYTLGHDARLKRFYESLPKGIYALGSCFQGVAVNDCIQNAKTLALEFL